MRQQQEFVPRDAAIALINHHSLKADGPHGSRHAQYRAAEVDAREAYERSQNSDWLITAKLIADEYHDGARSAGQVEQ